MCLYGNSVFYEGIALTKSLQQREEQRIREKIKLFLVHVCSMLLVSITCVLYCNIAVCMRLRNVFAEERIVEHKRKRVVTKLVEQNGCCIVILHCIQGICMAMSLGIG
jgi:uncharacterized membrane protein YbjE (DUF340 family)